MHACTDYILAGIGKNIVKLFNNTSNSIVEAGLIVTACIIYYVDTHMGTHSSISGSIILSAPSLHNVIRITE